MGFQILLLSMWLKFELGTFLHPNLCSIADMASLFWFFLAPKQFFPKNTE